MRGLREVEELEDTFSCCCPGSVVPTIVGQTSFLNTQVQSVTLLELAITDRLRDHFYEFLTWICLTDCQIHSNRIYKIRAVEQALPNGSTARKILTEVTDPTNNQPWTADLRGKQGVGLPLKGFRVELQGEREDMEDHSVVVDQFSDDRLCRRSDIKRLAYYGVFDGHNGSRASKFMEQEMNEHIMAAFAQRGGLNATDLDAAIIGSVISAFKSADTALLSKAAKQKPPWKDGTTATTALVVNNKVYVANVGDSKAVVCRFDRARKEHKVITLTVDHTPLIYEERQRIQQQGGFVRDGRLNGVLEVSRSLGDLPYKKNTGLSCVPSVHKYQLTADDKFLIIACDGLWKALSPADAMKVVLCLVSNAKKEELDEKYANACMALAKDSLKRLSGDNVTVLLIRVSDAQADSILDTAGV
ncbi:integrin-linked kinase-associated serine/threonine phosphatase 2C-like [Paramacrobiotus metropolitanus]|uniref:integrin-linked kinase-associated serine/threonine phosphatase 2C-like n=1 Tax=Paramacrobiotus metropolitanus TaxID=2943436 RepID=UPI0024463FD3|nr:integrin-linked kinase-associated serine/threonine phosphatase 2C-like [Paramacrobiotus metropolitanus]